MTQLKEGFGIGMDENGNPIETEKVISEKDSDDEGSKSESMLDAETMFNQRTKEIKKNEDAIEAHYRIGKIMGLGNLGEVRKCKQLAAPFN